MSLFDEFGCTPSGTGMGSLGRVQSGKRHPEGRVVDYSDAKLITTSEGQSYGMFFALVANDRESFDKIFAWSEKNLGPDQPALVVGHS